MVGGGGKLRTTPKFQWWTVRYMEVPFTDKGSAFLVRGSKEVESRLNLRYVSEQMETLTCKLESISRVQRTGDEDSGVI